MAVTPERWRGRRVLVTGHTGFKGSWLVAWLRRLGAEVTGFALEPPTAPSLFDAARLGDGIDDVRGDVRDAAAVDRAFAKSQPEVVIHMAAQSLVRASYEQPIDTYAVNVMGTVHVLDAARRTDSVRAVVVVTSDKCYENREWVWPYRENEAMGGHDPYSSSKGCAELVTAAYRDSYFRKSGKRLASGRAGNVIGGGDWATDRLVPDLVRAFAADRPAMIRNPNAIRPWQFVLEPLHGYLLLAEALLEGRENADAGWNFGPYDADVQPVRWIADHLAARWGGGASWTHDADVHPHEALTLKLDSAKARTLLGWKPRTDLGTALDWIVEFHQRFAAEPAHANALLDEQIARFEARTA